MNKVFDNYLFEAFANASDNIYVYVTDITTGITRWSERAVKYFNLENEYLENVKDIWPTYIHPDDRAVYQADIDAVFNGTSSNHHCQYRARNRFGEYVWVECRGSIIYDGSNSPKVFAGIMTRLDNPNKYDSLTHLQSIYEFFNKPIAENSVLMMIGVNDLRAINSRHGIFYGNKVIKQLADIISAKARSPHLFRFWGDDFILYDPDATVQDMIDLFDEIHTICSRTQSRSEIKSFSVCGGIVNITVPEDHELLIGRAEVAMSYAKHLPSHVAMYTPELAQLQSRKQAISEALVSSIQRDFQDFKLVYQPIVSTKDRSVIACEALLRWTSANDMLIPCYPNEFIPILQSNGGIIDVGKFVIRQAIRQIALWQKRYPGLIISINVSYRQLEDPDFAQSVIDEINKNRLDPSRVFLELTESVFVEDPTLLQQSFDFFRSHGVCISLDDFGRGNSSFWMLHNYKVDCIKLDQSFIRTIDTSHEKIDYAIVKSTSVLCQNIGCRSVAEGVENEEVYDKIKDFGFTALQGYLFSKPLSAENFEKYLDSHT